MLPALLLLDLALPRIILRFHKAIHKSNTVHCQVSLLISQTPLSLLMTFFSPSGHRQFFCKFPFGPVYFLQGKLMASRVHCPSGSLSRHQQPPPMLRGPHSLYPLGVRARARERGLQLSSGAQSAGPRAQPFRAAGDGAPSDSPTPGLRRAHNAMKPLK